MISNIRLWILRNAIDASNALLVIALFYFFTLGIVARLYVEFPDFFGDYLKDVDMRMLVNLLQVGVYLMIFSISLNYIYEFVKKKSSR